MRTINFLQWKQVCTQSVKVKKINKVKLYRRLFATATLVNNKTQQGRNSYSWLPQSQVQLISFVLTF